MAKSDVEQRKITSQVTGQIGWRRAGIKYRSHEVFLDVLESVSLLISPGGILSQSVSGVIHLRCLLSGMPECKLAINDTLTAAVLGPPKSEAKKSKKDEVVVKKKDPIQIDDLTFHQCVKLGTFDHDRSITFVPPDGDFDLMKYRTTQDIISPFSIHPNIQEHGNAVDITVDIRATFGLGGLEGPSDSVGLQATKIEIVIPVPTTTAGAAIEASLGKAKYKPGQNAIIWKISHCAGGKSATCKISIELLGNPSDRKNGHVPPFQ